MKTTREKKPITATIVRDKRKALGVSQCVFGPMVGKTRADIANYEVGRTIPPGDVLLRIQELKVPRGGKEKPAA